MGVKLQGGTFVAVGDAWKMQRSLCGVRYTVYLYGGLRTDVHTSMITV